MARPQATGNRVRPMQFIFPSRLELWLTLVVKSPSARYVATIGRSPIKFMRAAQVVHGCQGRAVSDVLQGRVRMTDAKVR